jgi:hypothetical protein
MDNKNMEAAQRLVDAALTKLEMPEELKRVVKQIAEIVILTALQEPDEPHADAASSSHPIEELFHRHVHSEEPRAATTDTPPESALRDELTRDYWRAIENITHAVSMTTQAGASPTRAHAAVRDYLLGRLALEQSLIHTLLELPREQHVDTHAHRAAPTTRARTSRSPRKGNGHA